MAFIESMHRNKPNITYLLTVFYPDVCYVEDGCATLPFPVVYMAVSGDGIGVTMDGKNTVAFELKCPVPNKPFTADVYYKVPLRYSLQILSQMATKGCEKYANICYTKESTTVFRGKFDEDLWCSVVNVLHEFAQSHGKRPTKKPKWVNELRPALEEFITHSDFVCEVPSLNTISCDCSETPDLTVNTVCRDHHTTLEICGSKDDVTMQTVGIYVSQAMDAVKEAYEHARRPAKELLLTVVSDLDRQHQEETPHALPIMYNMGGFSLKMPSARALLNEAMSVCEENGLDVRVIAFDGQFAEISIEDESPSRPLTLCSLAKQIWSQACSLTKGQQLSWIFAKNDVGDMNNTATLEEKCVITKRTDGVIEIGLRGGYFTIVTPSLVVDLITDGKPNTNKPVTYENEEACPDYIIQHLPDAIVDELDDKALSLIQSANAAIKAISDAVEESPPPTQTQDNTNTVDSHATTHVDYEAALCALIALTEDSKWSYVSLSEFQSKLATAEKIQKNFTVAELSSILMSCNNTLKKGPKTKLVEAVSEIFGDGSKLIKSPKSLKQLTREYIKVWNKAATNIVFATNTCMKSYTEWNDSNIFKGKCMIKTDDGHTFDIPAWYAQPSLRNNVPMQYIIDPHHLFVNNRARCCKYGMTGMGINSRAWKKVAEEECSNHAGLSVELVFELRDRQRNEFAQATFSEAVENAMLRNGHQSEARWCSLIRNWYRAVDEAGVALHQRITWMLEMRNFLLEHFTFSQFPPPGLDMKSMPIVQFEGILCNIDRRLQLYAMVSNSTYNHRAISSLDSETMFSSFQDLDPKGQGILRPDDIPTALGTAVCIFHHKLNLARPFQMKTSRKRVYPEHVVDMPSTSQPPSYAHAVCASQTDLIYANSHEFDKPTRKKIKPKRKRSTIAKLGECSSGASGVRMHHKLNEEKILPHRKEKIKDTDMPK